MVDIEREVELGGPISDSKGVLILSGFFAGRYALDTPMSLFASLVFEQSYSGLEGDSASSAEFMRFYRRSPSFRSSGPCGDRLG